MLRWKLNEARLETRVRRGAFADSSAVSAVSVANFVRAFATLPWELGEKTWRAVDAAVAREGTLDAAEMTPRDVANVAWALAMLEGGRREGRDAGPGLDAGRVQPRGGSPRADHDGGGDRKRDGEPRDAAKGASGRGRDVEEEAHRERTSEKNTEGSTSPPR